MNTTAADLAAILSGAKADGVNVIVHLANGDTVTGAPVSINSKGVNIKVDGKVRSFGLGRVSNVTRVDVSTDNMTTAEVAALLGMTPKELRVHLRALNMGVGKGRQYTLTRVDVTNIKNALNA